MRNLIEYILINNIFIFGYFLINCLLYPLYTFKATAYYMGDDKEDELELSLKRIFRIKKMRRFILKRYSLLFLFISLVMGILILINKDIILINGIIAGLLYFFGIAIIEIIVFIKLYLMCIKKFGIFDDLSITTFTFSNYKASIISVSIVLNILFIGLITFVLLT